VSRRVARRDAYSASSRGLPNLSALDWINGPELASEQISFVTCHCPLIMT
jgi:hypothetical protein